MTKYKDSRDKHRQSGRQFSIGIVDTDKADDSDKVIADVDVNEATNNLVQISQMQTEWTRHRQQTNYRRCKRGG